MLLFNCGSDSRVKSEILDRIQKLQDAGYEVVLGMVDLYRNPHASVADLEAISHDTRCVVDIVVQVMEIEAWFIGEYHHFERYNKQLSPAIINQAFNIVLETIDFEAIPHPASKLDKIYRLADPKGYKKRQHQVDRIVYCLDWGYFYLTLRGRSRSIDKLLTHLDAFLQ